MSLTYGWAIGPRHLLGHLTQTQTVLPIPHCQLLNRISICAYHDYDIAPSNKGGEKTNEDISIFSFIKDKTSDKENEGSLSGGLQVDDESYTGSGSTGPLSRTQSSKTGYDICPSSDLLELTGQTIMYSSTLLTMDSTPLASIPPSSSSEYASARSPSIASFGSLPSIPSLYSMASEGSTHYRTASEPSTTCSMQYQTADICPSEIRVIPSEEGTPRALEIGLPPESEGEREVTPSEVPLPSVVPSITSSPSSISISSPSTVSSVHTEDIPLPESVASELDLDILPSPSSVTSLPLPPPSMESSILLTLSPSLPSISLPPESTEVQSSIEFTESDESVAPPESTESPMTSVVLTPTLLRVKCPT
ncbi:hypothetical protein E1B28_011857 [Marasmius oreades]|uniref:Uncharacterized protein n=1 Tax=Marasmius oreades TaxID=181124 RepID=A0A9P7UQP0_9AGAR|nr:uncharacterized protein E1B28_011857 [Marasmius oreades]KAG7090260.1 hypothetical protein E1B28_011857 [Marasmius oreades]